MTCFSREPPLDPPEHREFSDKQIEEAVISYLHDEFKTMNEFLYVAMGDVWAEEPELDQELLRKWPKTGDVESWWNMLDDIPFDYNELPESVQQLALSLYEDKGYEICCEQYDEKEHDD